MIKNEAKRTRQAQLREIKTNESFGAVPSVHAAIFGGFIKIEDTGDDELDPGLDAQPQSDFSPNLELELELQQLNLDPALILQPQTAVQGELAVQAEPCVVVTTHFGLVGLLAHADLLLEPKLAEHSLKLAQADIAEDINCKTMAVVVSKTPRSARG